MRPLLRNTASLLYFRLITTELVLMELALDCFRAKTKWTAQAVGKGTFCVRCTLTFSQQEITVEGGR